MSTEEEMRREFEAIKSKDSPMIAEALVKRYDDGRYKYCEGEWDIFQAAYQLGLSKGREEGWDKAIKQEHDCGDN